ncbi:retrotransposon protein, putative, ty1-copia subclass [Tanacetum coccineum]|uniref:Retrotransposon protein, putative, ty1-copia subclass n=1 Tax=Tanacetum coccineum TaxID=301880 RepID=A0ABQ4ZE68_9ASTR
MQKARIRLMAREMIRRFISPSQQPKANWAKGAPNKGEKPSTTVRGKDIEKRTVPVYLAELQKKRKQVGSASSSGIFTIELFSFPNNNFWVYDTGFAELFEKRLISQEISGRAVDLEEIQEEEDTTPSEITSNIPQEVEGFEPPQEEVIPIRRKVCKLQRSIYGLKQASRSWNKRFDEEIKRFGFTQNLDEPCVYQKASGSNVTFLILFKMNNSKRGHIPMQERLDLNKSQGAQTPKEVNRMKNVTYASAGHGLLRADSRLIRMTLSLRQICFVLNEAQWIEELPSKVPLQFLMPKEPGVQKGARHYQRRYHYVRECVELGEIRILKVHTDNNLADPFTKALSNRKLTQHARGMGLRPASEPHWTAVKNILKYLRNTKDMFLVYGGNPSTELRVECYCDAGFETDRDDTKSQTGYVFVLNGGAVDGESYKQRH